MNIASTTTPETKPFSLWRLFALLKDHKKTVALLIFLIIISQGLSIVIPFITKVLIDALTGFVSKGGALPWHVLTDSAFGILAATLVGSIVQSSYNYHLFKVVTNIEDKLRSAAFEDICSCTPCFITADRAARSLAALSGEGRRPMPF